MGFHFLALRNARGAQLFSVIFSLKSAFLGKTFLLIVENV